MANTASSRLTVMRSGKKRALWWVRCGERPAPCERDEKTKALGAHFVIRGFARCTGDGQWQTSEPALSPRCLNASMLSNCAADTGSNAPERVLRTRRRARRPLRPPEAGFGAHHVPLASRTARLACRAAVVARPPALRLRCPSKASSTVALTEMAVCTSDPVL
jgi:hypothetical protein